MNTTALSGAMTRLGADEGSILSAIDQMTRLRSEAGHTRSAKIRVPLCQPEGALVLNAVMTGLVFTSVIDEDGETTSVVPGNIGTIGWALLSRLQSAFGHTARPAGMPSESREPGVAFVMCPFAPEQAGAFLKTVYRLRDAARESVKSAPSREKTSNLLVLNDFVLVIENILGDPVATSTEIATDQFLALF